MAVFGASKPSTPSNGVRTHYVTSGLPTPRAMLELPQLLRTIGIELLDAA